MAMAEPRPSTSSMLAPPLVAASAAFSAAPATAHSPVAGVVWALPRAALDAAAIPVDAATTTRVAPLSVDGLRVNGLNWSFAAAPARSKAGGPRTLVGVSLRCRARVGPALTSVSLDVRVVAGGAVLPIREPNAATPGLFSFEFALDDALPAQLVELWVLVRTGDAPGLSTPTEAAPPDDFSAHMAAHDALLYVHLDSVTGVRRLPRDGIGPLLLDDARTGDVELIADGGSVWAHSKVLASGWEWFRKAQAGAGAAPKAETAPAEPPAAQANGAAAEPAAAAAPSTNGDASTGEAKPVPGPQSPGAPSSFAISTVSHPRPLVRVRLPIPIATLRILVEYIYLYKTPVFEPDAAGVEAACALHSALVAYPLPSLLPLTRALITSPPLLTPSTVCPLLIGLESTPLRAALVGFAAANFSSVVKTDGWAALVFRKVGVQGGAEGLKVREETVKMVMEEVGSRV